MVTRSTLVGQADLQRQILVRGEAVYQCDVCKRKIRVPTNKYGLDIIQRCIITKTCPGKLHKVITTAEANKVSSVPPSLPNVQDWSQRRVFYLHEQPIENTIWAIEHNLANKPSVQVFITVQVDGEDVLQEADPLEVRIIDLNNVEVEFASPQKGQAQCLAFSSANTVNPDVGTPTVVAQETMQLTNNGELTIATADASVLLDITVEYRSVNVPGGIVNVDYVGVDNQPSLTSPWVGASKVFLNGRQYTVRSFNIVTQPLAPAVFAANMVANGSQFLFPSLGTTPNQNLILLGTPPFTIVDRVVNKYIDIATINQTQPELLYAGGEAFAAPSIIRSAYPHVYVVD
jgi:hypothetical protein